MRSVCVFFVLLLMLGGCYTKQVRHLSSDASLIKPGHSTKKDVLLYLGEPDGHRSVGSGREEFVYLENRRDTLNSMPLVRSWTDPNGYDTLIITLQGEQVVGCDFRTFHEDERGWADDFTWDPIE